MPPVTRDRNPQTPVAGAPLRQLREVRAAQLRALATRWAIGKTALGMLFLIGALTYSLGPAPRAPASSLWMALLVVLSTVHVGLGLRGFARVRRRGTRLWIVLSIAWGVLATVMMRILVGGR